MALTEESYKDAQRAMSRELKRAMKKMHRNGNPHPYFISYLLHSIHATSIWGRYGAVFNSEEYQENDLYAEVRVGDYVFDQTLDGGITVNLAERESHDWIVGPQDLDPDAIRYTLWKLTQRKYEEALRDFYDKKKVLVDQHLDQKVPSFSQEKKIRHTEEISEVRFPKKRWEDFIRKSSALFKKHKNLQDPYVRMRATHNIRVYVNSEGTQFRTWETFYEVVVKAWFLAEDGSWLSSFRNFYSRKADEFPKMRDMQNAIEEIVQDLSEQAQAQPLEPYAGPALLSGLTAGLIFHEALGHRLEGERMISRVEGRTFANRIGMPILPETVEIVDDPSLEEWEGTSLYGHYKVDDEGVRSQPVTLVREGKLESFLMSRSPVKGFSNSNGHGRTERFQDPMARMANLIVTSSETATQEELKARLCKEVLARGLPFGILIKGALGGETRTDHYDFQAFKGHPTAVYTVNPKTRVETRVRNVEFIGTPLAVIQRILAFGDDHAVDNSYCVAESGSVPVSTIAPSMLVGDLELQRSTVRSYRPPILPFPPMK
jgi:TldD protein